MISNGIPLRPKVLLGLSHAESSESLAAHLSRMRCESLSVPAPKHLENLREVVSVKSFDLWVLDLDVLHQFASDVTANGVGDEGSPSAVPIVFATQSKTVSPQAISTAFRLGAVDVVEMPFTADTLSRLAARALAGTEHDELPLRNIHDRTAMAGNSLEKDVVAPIRNSNGSANGHVNGV
jgi:DNA-binding NtrC family response regulator